jgi:hypothetical protein
MSNDTDTFVDVRDDRIVNRNIGISTSFAFNVGIRRRNDAVQRR